MIGYWNAIRDTSRQSFEEIRISDSSYSWWCKPISIYKDGFNWFSCIDINGDRQVYKFNLDGGSLNSQAYSDTVDEHSTAAILPLDDGEILVAFTGHNTPTLEYFKISELDLTTTQVKQNMLSGGVFSYVQLVKASGRVFCFTRDAEYTWSLCISTDNAVTFGSKIGFINKNPAIDDKLYISTQLTGANNIKIGIYNHALSGSNNVLNYIEINTDTGDVSSLGNQITNLYSGFTTIEASTLTPIYSLQGADDRFRFLDNVTTMGNFTYFLVCDFLASESLDYRSGYYKMVIVNNSDYSTKVINIVEHGKDTYLTYFGGVYFVQSDDGEWDGNIYLCREASEIWYCEKYEYTGVSFVLKEVLDTLPSGSTGNSGLSLTRPQPPYNSDKFGAKVAYQKGDYFEGFTNWDNEIIIE